VLTTTRVIEARPRGDRARGLHGRHFKSAVSETTRKLLQKNSKN
jgi:hypothetical protein